MVLGKCCLMRGWRHVGCPPLLRLCGVVVVVVAAVAAVAAVAGAAAAAAVAAV